MKTWLVTGGAGYIGSHIVEKLCENKFNVIVIDDLSTGRAERLPTHIPLYVGRIQDPEFLDDVFRAHKVTGIIHLAGKKDVAESLVHPEIYLDSNFVGTRSLAKVARDFNVNDFIFSSTAAVYGEQSDYKKVNEQTPLFPGNPYGESKVMAEAELVGYAEGGSMNVVILRFFNVTGFSNSKLYDFGSSNLVAKIRSALDEKTELEIFGTDYETADGTCIRDYIHVEDIAIAHIKCIEKLEKRKLGNCVVINLGSGVGYSVLDVIHEIEASSGQIVPWKSVRRRSGDSSYIVCDISKSEELLEWKPSITPFRDF